MLFANIIKNIFGKKVIILIPQEFLIKNTVLKQTELYEE